MGANKIESLSKIYTQCTTKPTATVKLNQKKNGTDFYDGFIYATATVLPFLAGFGVFFLFSSPSLSCILCDKTHHSFHKL